jgi:hypothetical protein
MLYYLYDRLIDTLTGTRVTVADVSPIGFTVQCKDGSRHNFLYPVVRFEKVSAE